jgi:hypothetical protein
VKRPTADVKVRPQDGVTLVLEAIATQDDLHAGESLAARGSYIIERLRTTGRLQPRILRRDAGRWDEMIVRDGVFVGYRIVRATTWRTVLTAPALTPDPGESWDRARLALLAKTEQERRFPAGRLLNWTPTHLFVDTPGWFQPQWIERQRPEVQP